MVPDASERVMKRPHIESRLLLEDVQQPKQAMALDVFGRGESSKRAISGQ